MPQINSLTSVNAEEKKKEDEVKPSGTMTPRGPWKKKKGPRSKPNANAKPSTQDGAGNDVNGEAAAGEKKLLKLPEAQVRKLLFII